MLIEQPDEFAGVEGWTYAREIVPELVVNPSTIGWVSDDPRSGGDGYRLGPNEFAVLLDIEGHHGIIGTPAELMNLAKQIQADLRSLRGALEIKARKANTWCMWCQQPIEHVRHPAGVDQLGPPDWWQHIVTCETACGQAYTTAKKDATPLLTVHPCQHCGEPVAEMLNAPKPLPEDGDRPPRWWWHIRNKVKVCSLFDNRPTTASPNLSEQWTPRPDLNDFATDPWAEKEIIP